jgi:hypothetical protein
MPEPRARVERGFRHRLRLEPPGVDLAAVALYLRQGDRPMRALLRVESIETLAPGELLYHSRPFSVGPWQVVPRIHLRWQQQVEGLFIQCRAPVANGGEPGKTGLSKAEKMHELDYAYGLNVLLIPQAEALEVRGALWIESALLSSSWAQPLVRLVMLQLQRRLEQRLERGLRRDFDRWYVDDKLS